MFGVEVPGAEGRAGMVVIGNPDNNLDLNNLALCVNKALPSYARPVFVRISPKLEMTGEDNTIHNLKNCNLMLHNLISFLSSQVHTS